MRSVKGGAGTHDTHLQCSVPLLGELRAALYRLGPDQGKVGHTAKVLCYCNAVVQVQNHMPPAAWNEDCLPRTLQNLNLSET